MENTQVVGAIIREKDKLLLVKNRTGFWTLPGGKLNSGEDNEAALYRELGEELSGIEVNKNETKFCRSHIGLRAPEDDKFIDIHTFQVSLQVIATLESKGEVTDAGFYHIRTILASKFTKDATKTILLGILEQ